MLAGIAFPHLVQVYPNRWRSGSTRDLQLVTRLAAARVACSLVSAKDTLQELQRLGLWPPLDTNSYQSVALHAARLGVVHASSLLDLPLTGDDN